MRLFKLNCTVRVQNLYGFDDMNWHGMNLAQQLRNLESVSYAPILLTNKSAFFAAKRKRLY